MSLPDEVSPDPVEPNRDWTRIGAEEVAERFGTDPSMGLSSDEASSRLARYGPNELASSPPEPGWRRLLRQFANPLIHLLLAAVVISVGAWVFEGANGLPVDAIVIAVIIVFNAVLGYIQESRANDAVAALQSMAAPTATVIRDGRTLEVHASEIVPGDLLSLAEGDSVAADARLVTASSLRIAEAALTGESVASSKNPDTLTHHVPLGDRKNMVHKGTAVTKGVGTAIVTATGMDTEMGRIAAMLAATTEEATPLTKEINRIGRTLGITVVIIAVVVMAALWAASGIDSLEKAVDVLIVGVSLAVAAVPEGLPAILTVVLSLGVQVMSHNNAIVKNLSSVETLGSASVICSDKTGTLPRNEMTLQEIRSTSGVTQVSGVGYSPTGEVTVGGTHLRGRDPDDGLREEATLVLAGGALASNAEVREETPGVWTVVGDPTEAAFIVAERKAGIEESHHQRFTRLGEVPFTSERKMMSVVVADVDHPGRLLLIAKGAPDVLLGLCTSIREGAGERPLTSDDRDRINSEVRELADQALRTLGVAYRELGSEELDGVRDSHGSFDGDAGMTLEHDLVWVGTAGIIDPPRPEAAKAIAEAHRAGIRVVMITGDHPATALRIARELGIAGDDDRVLAGHDLNAMSPDELAATVGEVSVFARVAPEHKLQIISALQAQGHIVSMTGDGVNDAPALKRADIGVAMGITGTAVSKEAADMILVDDNFSTIVSAIRQGRVIFGNIKKFLRYLLASNMGEVLTMILGVVLAGFLGLTSGNAMAVPLLATQILWINLVTDSGPALAMGIDPPTEDVMAQPPRDRSKRVIDGRMWGGIISIGTVMAVVTLTAVDAFLPGGFIEGDGSISLARTAAFTTLVLAQLFNALNSRSETVSAFHRLFANGWLWAALVFGVVSQMLAVHVPLLQAAFGTEAMSPGQWAICLGLASVVLWFDEARKLVLRRVDAR